MDDSPDELIAQICHELRAPLTPIKGYLQTLLRRDEELGPEERRHIYEVLLREEQRMEDLVRDLLRAATPGPELEVANLAVDWPTIVNDQVDLYQQSDVTREVAVEIDPQVGEVLADVNLAIGVLANLLTNALRYAPAGTPIAISVSLDGDRVVTTVSDRGPGVPAEHRERIFDRFAQVRESRATSAGVGLGLYLARRSVEAMNGEIWYADNPGGGAQLAFTLPAARPR